MILCILACDLACVFLFAIDDLIVCAAVVGLWLVVCVLWLGWV